MTEKIRHAKPLERLFEIALTSRDHARERGCHLGTQRALYGTRLRTHADGEKLPDQFAAALFFIQRHGLDHRAVELHEAVAPRDTAPCVEHVVFPRAVGGVKIAETGKLVHIRGPRRLGGAGVRARQSSPTLRACSTSMIQDGRPNVESFASSGRAIAHAEASDYIARCAVGSRVFSAPEFPRQTTAGSGKPRLPTERFLSTARRHSCSGKGHARSPHPPPLSLLRAV